MKISAPSPFFSSLSLPLPLSLLLLFQRVMSYGGGKEDGWQCASGRSKR